MRYDEGKLQEMSVATVELGKNTVVLVRLLAIGGKQYVDIRKWIRWRGDDDFNPTKKGFCMELENFADRVLPTINQIAHNAGYNKGHVIDGEMNDSTSRSSSKTPND